MKSRYMKFIIIIFIMSAVLMGLKIEAQAASMGLSINKTTATVGDTFRVTISGINGKVSISANSNISISPSGTQWVEGSLTISGTAKAEGTGTITVTPIDASTTSAEPQEVTSAASRSITINKKEEPKQEAPVTTTQTTPTTQTAPKTTTSTPKTTTTTKKTETKTETKKTETPKVEEKKEQEDNFYINSVIIKGLKENGEQVQIELSPEFKKDVYEYTCNIPGDVQRIDIQKDAGKFTNSVIVKGAEDIKDGENIIILQLSAEDHQAKTYTIKVNKEKKEETEELEEVVETIGQIAENNIDHKEIKEGSKGMISMPVWSFVFMQILIIAIEVFLIIFVPWPKLLKLRRKRH